MQVRLFGGLSAALPPQAGQFQPKPTEPDQFSPRFGMTAYADSKSTWSGVVADLDRWIEAQTKTQQRQAAERVRQRLRENGAYPATDALQPEQVLPAVQAVVRYIHQHVPDNGQEANTVWRNTFREALGILRPYVNEAVALQPGVLPRTRLAIDCEGSMTEHVSSLKGFLAERWIDGGRPLYVLGILMRMSRSLMPDTIDLAGETLERHGSLFEKAAVHMLQKERLLASSLSEQDRNDAEAALWFLGRHADPQTAVSAVFDFWQRIPPLEPSDVWGHIAQRAHCIQAMYDLRERKATGFPERLAEQAESIRQFLDTLDALEGGSPDEPNIMLVHDFKKTTNQIRRELLGDAP